MKLYIAGGICLLCVVALILVSHESHRKTDELRPARRVGNPNGEKVTVHELKDVNSESKFQHRTEGDCSISGTIYLSAPPTPAAHAHVALVAATTRLPLRSVFSDEDGTYEFGGLDPGSYSVLAWQSDWTMLPTCLGADEISLQMGQHMRDVDRTLVRGVVLVGRVIDDMTAEPIQGAQIRHGMSTSFTAEDGTFVFEGLPEGCLLLIVSKESYATDIVQTRAAVGDRPELEISLFPGGTIAGKVTHSDGTVASGARVDAYSTSVQITAYCDENGRYSLNGVPLGPGPVRVEASHGALHRQITTVSGFAGDGRALSVDIQLSAGVRVGGYVIDSRHRPVAAVQLFLDQGGDLSVGTTDSEGYFSVDGIPANTRLLTARKVGFGPCSVNLDGLLDRERTGIVIELPAGRLVTGHVEDKRGHPLAGAVVYCWSAQHAGPYASAVSDHDGSFSLSDVGLDIQSANVRKQGFQQRIGVPLPEDGDELRIVLEESGIISGRLVDQVSEEPVRDFSIRVRLAARDARTAFEKGAMLPSLFATKGFQFRTQDGKFDLSESLTPGITYALTVVADGFIEKNVECSARSHSTFSEPFRIALDPGAVLRGIIQDRDTARVINGVRISYRQAVSEDASGLMYWDSVIREKRSAIRTTYSDHEGVFALDGMAGESGLLLFEKPGYARTLYRNVTPSTLKQIYTLPPEATVEGRVWTIDSEPLTGLSVEVVVDGQAFPGGMTDRNGWYRVVALPEGSATLEIAGQDVREVRKQIQLRAGETTHCDVAVADVTSGRATGEVVNGLTGAPVFGSYLQLRKLVGDVWKVVRERENHAGLCTFQFEDLQPGVYFLTSAPDSKQPMNGWVGPIEIAEGEEVLGVELPVKGGTFEVAVLDESGAPPSGARVVLRPTTPIARVFSSRCDQDGKASFRDMPGGEYRLRVHATGYVDWEGIVTLDVRGGTLSVTLQPNASEE